MPSCVGVRCSHQRAGGFYYARQASGDSTYNLYRSPLYRSVQITCPSTVLCPNDESPKIISLLLLCKTSSFTQSEKCFMNYKCAQHEFSNTCCWIDTVLDPEPELFGHVVSGSNLFNKKICVNFFFKMVQFFPIRLRSHRIHISLENRKKCFKSLYAAVPLWTIGLVYRVGSGPGTTYKVGSGSVLNHSGSKTML
jgi:hypothetical protein